MYKTGLDVRELRYTILRNFNFIPDSYLMKGLSRRVTWSVFHNRSLW